MVKYQFSLTHYSIFQEVVAFQTVKENFVKKSKIKVKSRAGNVDTQIQCLSRTEPWSLSSTTETKHQARWQIPPLGCGEKRITSFSSSLATW